MAGKPQATLWEVRRLDQVSFAGPTIYFEVDPATGILGGADNDDPLPATHYPVRRDGMAGFQDYTTDLSGSTSVVEQVGGIGCVNVLDPSDTSFGYGQVYWQQNGSVAEPHDTPVGEDLFIENRGLYDGFNDADPDTHRSGYIMSQGKRVLRRWRKGTTTMAVVSNVYFEAVGIREDAIEVFLIPKGTAQAVGDGIATNPWVVPAKWNGANLIEASVYVQTEGVGGTAEFQVRRLRGDPQVAVDMLTAKISVAASAFSGTSTGVDTANDDLATGDMIAFDCDQVHSTTPALGAVGILKVRIP